MLIKPQEQSASSLLGHRKRNEAEEKKHRIDEALQRYEHAHPTQATEQNHSKTVGSHQAAETAPAAQPHHKPDNHLTAAQVQEALITLHPKKLVKSKEQSVTQEVFVPTQIDPEAPIAAAVVAVKQREAEAAAEREAESTKPANRYRQPQTIILGALFSKKFIVFAALWLLAIPLAIILYSIISSSGGVASSKATDSVLMAFEYALGAYGALGWVPLVVFYIREHKDL